MVQRRRWVMTGPWRHPDSGIWYFRKATPRDLLNRRSALGVLGIRLTREVQRSLKTRDYSEAKTLYARVSLEVEDRWDIWRLALRNGPVELNHRQVVALAALVGKELVQAHEDNPSSVPRPPSEWFGFLASMIQAIGLIPSIYMGDPLKDFMEEIQSVPIVRLESFIEAETPNAAPWKRTWLQATLALLEAHKGKVGQTNINRTVSVNGVWLSDAAMQEVKQRTKEYVTRAYDTMSERLDGFYGEPRWITEAPEFVSPRSKSSVHNDGTMSVTLSEIIDEQVKLSKLGSVKVSSSTERKYRANMAEFDAFRNATKAASVTLADLKGYHEYLDKKRLASKTIRNKLASVQTVLNWGQMQHEGRLFPEEVPWKYFKIPKAQRSSKERSYSIEQAKTLLLVARREGVPYRRWVPWLLAYSGMRIGEVLALEREDLFEENGWYFLKVMDDGKLRTTKTGLTRLVPIHPDLVREGFIEFCSSVNTQKLFDGNSLAPRFGEWVNATVFSEVAEHPSPAHGLRHFWEGRAMGRVEEVTARRITGRKEGGSVGFYLDGVSARKSLAEGMANYPSVFADDDDDLVDGKGQGHE